MKFIIYGLFIVFLFGCITTSKSISCRIGMTTDPDRRKKEWERKENCVRNWKILGKYQSKKLAQEIEIKEAKKQNCDYHSGGRGKEKDNWFIYRFEFSN